MLHTAPFRYAVFIPAVLCAVLSLSAAFIEATLPVFHVFLPICFVFTGMIILRQQKQIEGLEAERKRLGPADG